MKHTDNFLCRADNWFSFYRPQTKLREGIVFTPVCDSVHGGGGVYPSMQWAGGVHPARQTPPGQTPPRETPPPRRQLKRALRILLEYILVITSFNLPVYHLQYVAEPICQIFQQYT